MLYSHRVKAILTCLAAIAAGTPAMAQELRCGASTIRLVCEHRDAQDGECDASHAEFILEGGATKIVRTPKGLDARLIPDVVECAPGDGGNYVIIVFSNGGECGACLNEDIFKIDGTPLTKKGKYVDRTIEKLHIPLPKQRDRVSIR